jgi:hypothetical protein
MKNKTLRFKTAGYSGTDTLAVDVGPSQCGEIKDGVAFWHDNAGAWLVSYADLMVIADAATAVRSRKAPQADDAVARSVPD